MNSRRGRTGRRESARGPATSVEAAYFTATRGSSEHSREDLLGATQADATALSSRPAERVEQPQGRGIVHVIPGWKQRHREPGARNRLAFRGLTFWIPMLLGFLAVQRMQVFGPSQRDLTSTWGVRFTAIFVALMGIINVLSAVTPSLAERLRLLEQYSPLEVQRGGHLTAALAGFGLIALARSLDRRKPMAWILTEILLGLSILSHMIKGLDYEESILAGILIIVLWRMRDEFHARSDPPSSQQGIRVLLGALIFTGCCCPPESWSGR